MVKLRCGLEKCWTTKKSPNEWTAIYTCNIFMLPVCIISNASNVVDDGNSSPFRNTSKSYLMGSNHFDTVCKSVLLFAHLGGHIIQFYVVYRIKSIYLQLNKAYADRCPHCRDNACIVSLVAFLSVTQ